jgi:DNA-binding response OmpR family regulator
MSATLDNPSALIVEPSLDDLPPFIAALSAAGFRVTAAANFVQAKALLDLQVPALLMTAVRLGAYNGLHLVMRAKAAAPKLAAIVTSTMPDPVLQAEADAMDASFLVKPFDSRELIAAAWRTLCRDSSGPPLRAPFERRSGRERRHANSGHHPERRVGDRRRVLGPSTGLRLD